MSSRPRTTTSTTNKSHQSKTATTDLDDDWETDPDFERHMDEIDQRWGSKRTVGSINMTKLIDEVHNDHRSLMRERFLHPSQTTIDQHSTSTTSKKVITKSSSSSSSGGVRSPTNTGAATTTIHKESYGPQINEMKKTLFERSGYEKETAVPSSTTIRPSYERDTDFKDRLNRFNQPNSVNSSAPRLTKSYETSAKSHKVLRDETTSPGPNKYSESTSPKKSTSPTYSETQAKARELHREIEDEVPKAFRSIQAKIDAYKKEMEELQNTMAKKAHLSEKIKKTASSSTNSKFHSKDSSENIEYVDSEPRTTKVSSNIGSDFGSIKSMREKFNNLLREDEDDFRRRTEEKRKQFFNEIESQVHETRRGLDGFDDPMMDDEFEEMKRKFMERNREHLSRSFSTTGAGSQQPSKQKTPSPTFANQHGSHSSLGLAGSPKVYTKRETHREEVVSRLVKENDKVIENETKRNVQHSSSCHGSSDEEEPQAIGIPINRDNHQSPTGRVRQNESSQSSRNNSPLLSQPSQYDSKNLQQRKSPIQSSTVKTPDRNPSPNVLKSSTSKANTAGLMARTLYDYDAADVDELSFDIDELITNIEKIDVGWYRGIITSKDGSKREGLFPANYVKLLNDDGEY